MMMYLSWQQYWMAFSSMVITKWLLDVESAG